MRGAAMASQAYKENTTLICTSEPESIPNSPGWFKDRRQAACVEKDVGSFQGVADVFSAKPKEMAGPSWEMRLETESYAMRKEDTQTAYSWNMWENYIPHRAWNISLACACLKLNRSIWLEFCPHPLTKGGGGGEGTHPEISNVNTVIHCEC